MYLIQLVFCTTDLTIPAKLTHVYQTEQFTLGSRPSFHRFPAIGVELSISLATNVASPLLSTPTITRFTSFWLKNAARATVACIPPVPIETATSKRIIYSISILLKTSLVHGCRSDLNLLSRPLSLLIRFRKGKFNLWRLY